MYKSTFIHARWQSQENQSFANTIHPNLASSSVCFVNILSTWYCITKEKEYSGIHFLSCREISLAIVIGEWQIRITNRFLFSVYTVHGLTKVSKIMILKIWFKLWQCSFNDVLHQCRITYCSFLLALPFANFLENIFHHFDISFKMKYRRY